MFPKIWTFGFVCVLTLHIIEAATNDDDSYVVVRTVYGDVRGLSYTHRGVQMQKFLGIPYAQPPLRSRRFMPPEPPSKWSGVRDTLKVGYECPQTKFPEYTFVRDLPMNEDCLYLNIYAPAPNDSTSPLPVMVWIHGGGFNIGGGSQYEGTFLAAKGVIVVTINYRLAALGFLSTETDEMPGNYGMMDQVQALRWVQENIASFGGDPNKVTIFGESAGSASVSLHTISPLSKGLFHRAIMESGVSLSPWAVSHAASRMSPRMLTNLVARDLDCPRVSPSVMIVCLQTKDAYLLHNTTEEILTALGLTEMLQPRVENVFGFLPDVPINLLTKGDINAVDAIRGFNTDEAGIGFDYFLKDGNKTMTLATFKDLLSSFEFSNYALPGLDQIKQDIVDMYVGNATDEDSLNHQLENFLTDYQFIAPTLNEINLVAKAAPATKQHMFEFRYRPSFSQVRPWMKAVHGDELMFVFGVENEVFKNFVTNPTPDDVRISELVMTLWSNFAKTGDVSVPGKNGSTKWDVYTTDKNEYLLIDQTSSVLTYNRPEDINFNLKLIQKLDTFLPPSNTIVG